MIEQWQRECVCTEEKGRGGQDEREIGEKRSLCACVCASVYVCIGVRVCVCVCAHVNDIHGTERREKEREEK